MSNIEMPDIEAISRKLGESNKLLKSQKKS